MEYTAITKEMSNGWHFAQCEQLPAAMTQGKTVEEALENLKDAILLLLEDEKEDFQKSHFGFIRRKIEFA
jgi:predicted RNase H-like HicB family nuclease